MKNIVATFTIALLLIGCGGSTQPQQIAKASKPQNTMKLVDNYTPLGYAYLSKENSKLISISTSYTKPKSDDIEVIKIFRDGYYPNYKLTPRLIEKKDSFRCSTKMKETMQDYHECESLFATREAVETGVATLLNAFVTVAWLGTNIMTGAVMDPKFFDKEVFFETVKKNNLDAYRQMFIKEQEYQQELDYLYEIALRDYTLNKKNIAFKYITKNASRLPLKKTLKAAYYLESVKPNKRSFNFSHIYENNTTVNSNILSQMKRQYETYHREYKNYLANAFTHYNIKGSKSNIKYNDNISFNVNMKSIKKLSYSKNKKATVPVHITIQSANLTNMIPKYFTLKDSYIHANLMLDSQKRITVLTKNKTRSFLTQKSLTSYYRSDVFNQTNLHREIAPKSITLKENSTYNLLSSKMINNSSFRYVTNTKAHKTFVTYGYALKYRIHNTNVDKAVYSTKNFKLIDLYRQYL